MPYRITLLIMCFSTLGFAGIEDNCPFSHLAMVPVKALALPVVFPLHVWFDRMSVELDAITDPKTPPTPFMKTLGHRLLKDIPFFLFYSGTIALNQFMDPTYYEEELEEDIERSREEHKEEIPQGLKIFVNVFDPEDRHFNYAKQKYADLKRKTKDLIYIEAESLSDGVAQVQLLSQEKNQPVALVKFNGHGLPGQLEEEKIEDFANGEFGYFAHRPRTGSSDFFHLDPELFERGAQIEFHSCLVGQGEQGKKALKTFGKVLLSKGGVVYAPTVLLTNNPARQRHPTFYRFASVGHQVLPPLKFGFNLYDQAHEVDPEFTLGQRLNIRNHSLVRVKIEP